MNDDLEKQQIIETIGTQTNALLNSKWEAIQALRADPEKPFPISFQHRLAFGDKQIVKTKISFGIRESESMETTINNKSQMQLFGTNGHANGHSEDENETEGTNRFTVVAGDGDEHEESLSIAAAAASEPASPLTPKKKRAKETKKK